MSANFTLDGTENLRKIFEDMPERGYRKPIIAAFRKAADPVKRAMSARLPASLKAVKKILKIKPGKGKSLTLAVGFFGDEGKYINSKGTVVDAYNLVYWLNYGTLSNRDRMHKFKTQRRKISASWGGGITAVNFVDRAWEDSRGQAQNNFETTFQTELEKFMLKEAKK